MDRLKNEEKYFNYSVSPRRRETDTTCDTTMIFLSSQTNCVKYAKSAIINKD